MARQKSDFATPFKDASRALPLGSEPVLLTRGQLRPQGDGGITLALAPEKGGGIDLALNPTLLHSFVALLDQALEATDWDLAPSLPPVTAPSRATTLN